jgi:hypothetical protein
MTTSSSSPAQQLGLELQAAVDELSLLVQSVTPDEWARRGENSPIWSLGADEERSVGVIAYHAAQVIGVHTAMVRAALAGQPLLGDGRWEIDGVAQWNASVAKDKQTVTPIEVLGDLMTNSGAALDVLRGMSDADLGRHVTDLDRAAVGPFYPTLQTLGQLVDEGLIGHIKVHRESLRATLGR